MTLFKVIKGQSLIEIIIAMGLISILLPAIFTGLIASREGKAQEEQRLQATALVREAEETARSVREKDWSEIATSGVYHPVIDGNAWSLALGDETTDGFTRQIEISDVNRDNSTGEIVESGGVSDPSTKKLVTTVSWSTPIASQVESTLYLERHLRNQAWLQTTVGNFNAAGTIHDGTTTVPAGGGAVELDPNPAGTSKLGNEFIVNSTGPMLWLILPTVRNNMRFTAQNTKTVDKIKVYVHSITGTSPVYRFGIQSDNGGNPSGTFLGSATYQPTSTGWHTIDIANTNISAGSVYHLVVQHESGTVNFTNYIQLRQSNPLNALYPFDNNPDTNANTGYFWLGSWNYTNNQPIYALEFTDSTFEGNPYETGDEFEVYQTLVHGEEFKVNTPTTAVNINWLIRKKASQNPQGPLEVVLEDLTGGTVLATGTIATPGSVNQTYSYYTYTFTSPIQLVPASTYRVFVRASNTTQARAYMIRRVNNATAQNLNSINYDGENSKYYTSAFGGVTVSYWDAAGWFFTVEEQAPTSGQFTSQIFNAGSVVAFNNITWTENLPPSTDIRFQINIGGAGFIGPDGTISTYYTEPSLITPLNLIQGQTIQYKAFLSGNDTGSGIATPTLFDTSINYSP